MLSNVQKALVLATVRYMCKKNYNQRIYLIRDHDVVRSKASSINGVLIIRLTLVIPRILLRRRINFHF